MVKMKKDKEVLVELSIYPREGWKMRMVCKDYFLEENVNAEFLCDFVWEKGYKLVSFEVIEESKQY